MTANEASYYRRILERPSFIAECLFVLTVIVFWPARRCDFIVYDDYLYVAGNPHVLGGLTAANFSWAFRSIHAANWHPLTWISHMLDAQLFGRGPAGPHIVNILFHAANTVLLFLVLRRLTAAHWRSAWVAAIFAWHPLHVQSVAWVAERKDVLSTFFFLLTLGAYARYAFGAQKLRSYRLAVLFFTLGLLSKPMLVTLPFLLLLLDWWPLGRVSILKSSALNSVIRASPGALLLEKWPFFLLSAASCVITSVAQRSGGAFQSLERFSVGGRIENALVAYGRYLGKIIWPQNLAYYYPHPAYWPVADVAVSAVVICGICLVALWLRRKFPFCFTGWFLFLGMLVPVIGLVQVGGQAMADRYSYLPSIGIFIVVAWGAGVLVACRPGTKAMIVLLAGITLVAGITQTRSELGYWQNSQTLAERAIAVTHDNYVAYNDLGLYYEDQNEPDKALQCFQTALQINPGDKKACSNMGIILTDRGQVREAIDCFNKALAPGFVTPYRGLGKALTLEGDLAGAIRSYQQALAINPESVESLNGLGIVYAGQNRANEAVECFEKATALDPEYFDAWVNLGRALGMMGRFPDATAALETALRLKPSDPIALCQLGVVLAKSGRLEEAAQRYQDSLRANPDDPSVHLELGRVLASLGRLQEAATQFNEALRLSPNYTEARDELGRLGGQN